MSYTYEAISKTDVTALDLRAELDRLDEPVECAAATIDGKPERAQVVFFPDAGRAGIAWGADAVWTDANSIEEALDRYLFGEMGY